MAKRKENPSKTGLSSPQVQGQGTTDIETGVKEVSSSRKKTKRY
ncbi:YuzL family protein [Bacillus kwashiorkori]|nr:YuzL family protein [Bacillus kwashiorkori]